jgi:hypothetical protein
LWNGEFYVQKTPGDVDEHRYQYGAGCLSDQMLGQWFAHVLGLGYLLPQARVQQAMGAVFRHNWRPQLADHHNCQRVYALNDEPGLLLCSWPNGGRPNYPFPYADEVWTGIEYQVAAHLIYEGLIDEGLAVVRGVRSRHDGVRRNPWDEFECGHHYARAMASWSVLLALSGFRCSAPDGTIGFAPRVSPESFRCFFSAGSSWGLYAQELSADRQSHRLEVREGSLAVKEWTIPAAGESGQPASIQVTHDSPSVPATAEAVSGSLTMRFQHPLTLAAGQVLEATIAWS